MAVRSPFSSVHVSSLAARAAELERIGEETQDPSALLRAARLYKLAVRIADDIDHRVANSFNYADLARVRDELRVLATEAAASLMVGDGELPSRTPIDSTGAITRMLREVAARIEQRLAGDDTRPRPRADAEPRA